MSINRIITHNLDLSSTSLSFPNDAGASAATLQISSGPVVPGTLVSGNWTWDDSDLAAAGFTRNCSMIINLTVGTNTQQIFCTASGVPALRITSAVNDVVVSGIDDKIIMNGHQSHEPSVNLHQEGNITLHSLYYFPFAEGLDAGEYQINIHVGSDYDGETITIKQDGSPHVATQIVDPSGNALFIWNTDTLFNLDNSGPTNEELEAGYVSNSIWPFIGRYNGRPLEISIDNTDNGDRAAFWRISLNPLSLMYDYDEDDTIGPFMLEIQNDAGASIYDNTGISFDQDAGTNTITWNNPLDFELDVISLAIDSGTYPWQTMYGYLGYQKGDHYLTMLEGGVLEDIPINSVGVDPLTSLFDDVAVLHNNRSIWRFRPFEDVANRDADTLHMRNKSMRIGVRGLNLVSQYVFDDCPIVLSYYDSVTEQWYHSNRTNTATTYMTPILIPGSTHTIEIDNTHVPTHWAISPLRGELSCMMAGETVRAQTSSMSPLYESETVSYPVWSAPGDHFVVWDLNGFAAVFADADLGWYNGGSGIGNREISIDHSNISGAGPWTYSVNINFV